MGLSVLRTRGGGGHPHRLIKTICENLYPFVFLYEMAKQPTDWKVEVKGWIEVTSRQLNEVRPQLGSRMVSKDVTSPSKLKNSFIVM